MAILIEANRNFSFAGSPEDIVNNSKDFLMANGFKLTGETGISNGYSLHAKRGSEIALRILGSLFSTSRQLPIKINIKVMTDNQIFIYMSSDIHGIGTSFGLNNKFQNCFNQIFNNYSQIIRSK